MHILSFIVILTVFFSINTIIVISDIKYKKIPNRNLLFLLFLLPFFYIYLFATPGLLIEATTFFIQMAISLVISFLLYYHGVWSAGDAKYLLILSLYLPIVGTIPFIGNLALITITYLLGYYVYFYGKLLFRWTVYRNSLFATMFTDQKDRMRIFINNHKKDGAETKRVVYGFVKFLLMFLVFFVSIRLVRSYVIEDLESIGVVRDYIAKYPTYFIFVLGGFFLLMLHFLRKILIRVRVWMNRIITRYGYAMDLDLIFTLLLFFLLAGFIAYEYAIDSREIGHKLFLVFTLYLGLFFIFKALFYSYKVTFQLGEQDIIPISRLRQGDLVDKEYLIKLFWSQKSLWYRAEKWLLAPSPQEYFQNMENPIDHEAFTIIKKAYRIVNHYHKKEKTPGFEAIQSIKVLKMFSFGIYILSGFLITFIWWELPFQIIVQNFLKAVRLFHL